MIKDTLKSRQVFTNEVQIFFFVQMHIVFSRLFMSVFGLARPGRPDSVNGQREREREREDDQSHQVSEQKEEAREDLLRGWNSRQFTGFGKKKTV
jgi:hypothetical protein